MITILLLLIVGVALGRLLKSHDITRKISDKVSLTVIAILFTFGIKIGADSDLIAEIGQLGLSALAISTAGIAGSLVFACIIDRYVKSKRRR